MSNLNEVTLIGRLGQQPNVVKQEGENPSFVVCQLATNEYWNHEGEKHSHVEWHTIHVGVTMADFIVKYCDAGDEIFVRGRLRTKKWEKDGIEHSTTAIKADSIQLLRKKADADATFDEPQKADKKDNESVSTVLTKKSVKR